MSAQGDSTLGGQLLRALKKKGWTQSRLAQEVHIDPSRVSLWTRDLATPSVSHLQLIDEALGSHLEKEWSPASRGADLYVSAPITGLSEGALRAHNLKVAQIVTVVRKYIPNVYWPGEDIHELTELAEPDITTEQNMRVLGNSSGLLYLQFADMVHPSGALMELGIALGRKLRTTVIVDKGLATPYMLNVLPAVGVQENFLPKARVYQKTVKEAIALIDRHKADLFGFDDLEELPEDDPAA
jgi:transcriptional regulator with XRE-family HTH domain